MLLTVTHGNCISVLFSPLTHAKRIYQYLKVHSNITYNSLKTLLLEQLVSLYLVISVCVCMCMCSLVYCQCLLHGVGDNHQLGGDGTVIEHNSNYQDCYEQPMRRSGPASTCLIRRNAKLAD